MSVVNIEIGYWSFVDFAHSSPTSLWLQMRSLGPKPSCIVVCRVVVDKELVDLSERIPASVL